MQSHLNVDQWVMARDRHRLNRLRKDKKTETAAPKAETDSTETTKKVVDTISSTILITVIK